MLNDPRMEKKALAEELEALGAAKAGIKGCLSFNVPETHAA